MARDYRHRARAKPKRKPVPGWVFLLAGLLLGLFVALLVYLGQSGSGAGQSSATGITPPSSRMSDTRDVRKEQGREIPNPPKPRFDFYTLLPEMEVVVPEADPVTAPSPPASAEPAPAASPGNGQGLFMLQVGSFRKADEADALKASLALSGFDVSIVPVRINDEQWSRVHLGPYASQESAQQARTRLRSMGLDAMLLRKRP